jgi:hypothetical protein
MLLFSITGLGLFLMFFALWLLHRKN